MKLHCLVALALLLLCLSTPAARAQESCGFGLRGFGGVRTGSTFKDLEDRTEAVVDVAVQADGKIVVVGNLGYDFGVTRFLPDGSLDESFGPAGTGTVRHDFIGSDIPTAVAIRPDGCILVIGETGGAKDTDFAVLCLNPNGFPNANFGGGDGVVLTDFGDRDYARSIALNKDGSFVVSGTQLDEGLIRSDWDIVMAQYDGRGNLDTRFDGNGKKKLALGQHETGGYVQVLEFGRVMVAGDYWLDSRFFVHRFHGNGTNDDSLGNSGNIEYDFRYHEHEDVIDFVAYGAGRFFLLTEYGLYAFEANGQYRSGFGDHSQGGSTSFNISTGQKLAPVALKRLEDGRLLVAGTATSGTNDFAFACFLEDGRPDLSFGDGGYARHSIVDGFDFHDDLNAVAVAPDGKLVSAGIMVRGASHETALLRLYPDGSRDQDCVEPSDEPTGGDLPGGDRGVKTLFRRGDANTNGAVDLTDAIYTLEFLFNGDEEPTCMDALDANDDTVVDLSDATRTLGFLFLGKEAPPAPFDTCGTVARRDGLGCATYDGCEFRVPTKDLPRSVAR